MSSIEDAEVSVIPTVSANQNATKIKQNNSQKGRNVAAVLNHKLNTQKESESLVESEQNLGNK